MAFTPTTALLAWIALSIPPTIVSAVYFYSSPESEKFIQRLATSVHGLVISALFLGALLFGRFGNPKHEYGSTYGELCLVPIAIVIYSLWQFRGNKSVHILQAVNILWLGLAFFLGSMAVTGVWL
jgi:hypothetical protein